MSTIKFDSKPTQFFGMPYYWANVKAGVVYNIIQSYSKIVDGNSQQFLLIQENSNAEAPLIEVPLDNNFTYTNFSPSKSLNDNASYKPVESLNS